MDNKDLFRRYVEALGRPERLADVLAPDFVAHDLPSGGGGEALTAFRQAVKAATADQEITISDLIAEGDRVAARMTSRATHTGEFAGIAATDKPVVFEIFEIVRISQGRIAERWVATVPSIPEILAQLRA